MNPIENLWAILKWHVKQQQPKTIQDLISVIQEAWDEIPLEIINNLINSFKKRLLLLAKQEGKQIGPLLNSYNIQQLEDEYVRDEDIAQLVVVSRQDKNIRDILENPPEPFTLEEDMRILQLYQQVGARWKQIADIIGNKTSSAVRNRFLQIRGKDALKKKPSERPAPNYEQITCSSEITSDDESRDNLGHEFQEEPLLPMTTLFDPFNE